MKRQVHTLCVALLLLPIGRVQAADDATLVPADSGYNRQHLPVGQYVRMTRFSNIYGGSSWQYGTLEYSADSLVLLGDTSAAGVAERVTAPLSSLDRMQVRTGPKKGHSLTGFIVGGSLGLIGGAVAGVALVNTSFGLGDASPSNSEVTSAAVGGAFLGAFVLGGLGAIIGSLIKTDKWEEVPLDPVQIGLIPQPGGRQAFGLTVRF